MCGLVLMVNLLFLIFYNRKIQGTARFVTTYEENYSFFNEMHVTIGNSSLAGLVHCSQLYMYVYIFASYVNEAKLACVLATKLSFSNLKYYTPPTLLPSPEQLSFGSAFIQVCMLQTQRTLLMWKSCKK